MFSLASIGSLIYFGRNLPSKATRWTTSSVVCKREITFSNKSPARRPFILILQSVDVGNVWAVFVKQRLGNRLHILNTSNWVSILCNPCPKPHYEGSNHEQRALQSCLNFTFTRTSKVGPNGIVIDKCWASYNVIFNVVARDRHCLIVMIGHVSQTHYHHLLCQFHAKKSWGPTCCPK